jgi:hypothetical protein
VGDQVPQLPLGGGYYDDLDCLLLCHHVSQAGLWGVLGVTSRRRPRPSAARSRR